MSSAVIKPSEILSKRSQMPSAQISRASSRTVCSKTEQLSGDFFFTPLPPSLPAVAHSFPLTSRDATARLCVPQHSRFHSASRRVGTLPSGTRSPSAAGALRALHTDRWPLAHLPSVWLALHSVLKKKKKKSERQNSESRKESCNPSEVSPVEIIITEGYLVEYPRKW